MEIKFITTVERILLIILLSLLYFQNQNFKSTSFSNFEIDYRPAGDKRTADQNRNIEPLLKHKFYVYNAPEFQWYENCSIENSLFFNFLKNSIHGDDIHFIENIRAGDRTHSYKIAHRTLTHVRLKFTIRERKLLKIFWSLTTSEKYPKSFNENVGSEYS